VRSRHDARDDARIDGMQNLRELLLAGGATGLTGWRLVKASALSADGSTIVGFGVNSGRAERSVHRYDPGTDVARRFDGRLARDHYGPATPPRAADAYLG
jgi:hypothetical protein